MKKTASLLLCLVILSACGKDDENAAAPRVTTLSPETLSPEGCLNVPLIFGAMNGMDRNLPVLEVSTDFGMQSKKHIRYKFDELMAYSNFRAGVQPLSEFAEFSGFSQSGCESITFRAADGTEEVYGVKSSSSTSLRAEMEDGRYREYSLLSPTRLVIDLRYQAYDLPCGNPEPVLVRHRRVLDWSQASIDSLDLSADPFLVSRSFVELVAKAVGRSVDWAYEGSQPNGRRLGELAALPPQPELLTCPDGGLPPPESPPEEPEVPVDPDEEG